jgi:O-acetyl-ADP-ribose deacetylase (regulator of RNase III)
MPQATVLEWCTIDTMRVLLVDQDAALVRAWRSTFDEVEDVEVAEGDYFGRPADAMVSPANSFGIMDGGLDAAIHDALGHGVQQRVQQRIVERHHGELPVGCAEIVETGDARWPLLVVAPTMRVPEGVASTLNAYLAFRAALLACKRHDAPIGSLVCCGLATGIGRMEPIRCATQMRMAYRHATGPARIPSFREIHAVHVGLRTA